MALSPPVPLSADHDLSGFSCGTVTLDRWLVARAIQNQTRGASRTFVVAEDNRVVGYYSLASASIESQSTPGKVRRNMPNPIPALLLGRLAVDQSLKGQGLGRALLKDAVLRTLRVADDVGVRILLVHALDEGAAEFYRKHGFDASPLDPLILMLLLDQARRAL